MQCVHVVDVLFEQSPEVASKWFASDKSMCAAAGLIRGAPMVGVLVLEGGACLLPSLVAALCQDLFVVHLAPFECSRCVVLQE